MQYNTKKIELVSITKTYLNPSSETIQIWYYEKREREINQKRRLGNKCRYNYSSLDYDLSSIMKKMNWTKKLSSKKLALAYCKILD